MRRFQASLVVGQVATAVVLAVGAGLLLRTFSALVGVDPGYRTQGVLTASVAVPEDLYPDRDSLAAFFERPGARDRGAAGRAGGRNHPATAVRERPTLVPRADR